jgi:hypothetical protein
VHPREAATGRWAELLATLRADGRAMPIKDTGRSVYRHAIDERFASAARREGFVVQTADPLN